MRRDRLKGDTQAAQSHVALLQAQLLSISRAFFQRFKIKGIYGGSCLMRLKLLGIIIGAAVGSIVGLFFGMNLGGNYFEEFVFNGLRGYEAVGQIGAIVGGLFGAMCGWLFSLIVVSSRNRKTK